MKISHLTPDDPRLTAYALGELDAAEHVAVEAALKDNPAAQATVAQIRALSGDLSAALAKEPLPFVVPPPQVKDAPPTAREAYRPRKFLRLPFYLVGGLAAACVAAIFVLQDQKLKREDVRLAQLKAEAVQQRKMAAEMAKLDAISRGLIEVELKKDGDDVVHLPSFADKAKPDAKNDMYPEVVQLEKMNVEGQRQGSATALALQQPSTVTFNQSLGSLAASDVGAVVQNSVRSQMQKRQEAAAAPAGRARGVPSAPPPLASNNEGMIALNSFSVATEPPRMEMPAEVAVAAVGGAAKSFNTETYDQIVDNSYLDTAGNPLSTFSIDVDTAAYSNLRRFLNFGRRPPRDAVRIEEMVNYFPYNYTAPKDDKPFATTMEVASAPWNPQHRLVRIGLKGRELSEVERPVLNLVFLLDVSGSMNEPNKLPLVKESMRVLVEKLKPTDRVAIAVYAGASGLALPSTPISQKQEILDAIDALRPGGSTNGAMGIQLAYDIAKANFIKDGANRVVLCTDGDFNVGVTNQGDLIRFVEEKAKSGVFLTALGFGMNNYKDSTLEKLADKGNGNYGYVDNLAEAKKLLADQLSGTLVTIAKDVKIQVEFNPARVQSYRLIGYENRMLKKEDFNNDKIDAGEIGAGHTVTALYEIVPVGVESPTDIPAVDPLKYQPATAKKDAKTAKADASPELLTLKLRYKAPSSDVSSKLEFPLIDIGEVFANASQDFKFAAAVAGFGMLLRESPHKGTTSFEAVQGWAESGLGEDANGYRHEFMDLVRKAKGIISG
ncbi:MAG: von Willebrand factor type A domain-containing protein [Nibricoccus sp.]